MTLRYNESKVYNQQIKETDMKKYLFIALAALGFAACTESGDEKTPVQNAEMEESYIAINLMAADNDTRAAEDSYGYEDGTDAERLVNTAYFFFFDAEGKPFNVTGAPATAPDYAQDGKNYLSLAIGDTTGKKDPNVSDIKNAVLVLSTYKGVYPSQIVAVINWAPENKPYSLAELHSELATLGNDTSGYVMSNSVYMDGADKMVDAVPLTAANIKTTEEAAKAAPVEIYVERIAAKVVLTASGKVEGTTNIFSTQEQSSLVGLNNVDVYVQLHGWELYNDYAESNLLKNIDTTWDVATLGLTWNDIPYYRCYWAQSQSNNPEDEFAWEYNDAKKAEKGFQTNYGFAIASATNYTDRTTYTYCGENTNGEAYRTKVILKGQLMQKNQDETYSALELARWYGNEYAGKEALKIAVANSLKYTLYYKVGDNYVSIEPGDLECIEGAEDTTGKVKAYEVYFQLSTAGEVKTWYQYSSAEGYKVFGDNGVDGDNAAKANAYLKGVEPALLYTEGQTYYIVDIKHLGTEGKTAEFGVVRNHVYQIDIESIKGYGTPVYIGNSNLEDPEYPTVDEASYVAARINVLSWKVVKQGVDIVQ